MNRDYYTRPIQGHSRSQHDYGNTRLTRPAGEPSWLAGSALLIVGFLLLIAIAAVAAPQSPPATDRAGTNQRYLN